eukprot:GHRR01004913.1.p1 GENE.GHRR01004913.1~~GHRR01004913.1.p1  ORF type:complete len:572 (+),score=214.36 GHRR01004913.1:321-2036(+)
MMQQPVAEPADMPSPFVTVQSHKNVYDVSTLGANGPCPAHSQLPLVPVSSRQHLVSTLQKIVSQKSAHFLPFNSPLDFAALQGVSNAQHPASVACSMSRCSDPGTVCMVTSDVHSARQDQMQRAMHQWQEQHQSSKAHRPRLLRGNGVKSVDDGWLQQPAPSKHFKPNKLISWGTNALYRKHSSGRMGSRTPSPQFAQQQQHQQLNQLHLQQQQQQHRKQQQQVQVQPSWQDEDSLDRSPHQPMRSSQSWQWPFSHHQQRSSSSCTVAKSSPSVSPTTSCSAPAATSSSTATSDLAVVLPHCQSYVLQQQQYSSGVTQLNPCRSNSKRASDTGSETLASGLSSTSSLRVALQRLESVTSRASRVVDKITNGLTRITSLTRSAGVLRQPAGREVLRDYEFIGPELGRGASCVTRLVVSRSAARPAACKTISKAGILRSAAVKAALLYVQREVAIMQHTLCHPNVVQLLALYEDARSLHLVLEWCGGGSLGQLLQRAPGGRLPEPAVTAVAKAVLGVLALIHAKGVMHRDIKPDNLLITRPVGDAEQLTLDMIKVTDFGISVPVNSQQVRPLQ